MDDKLKELAYHYGFTSQADMLCEEAAEFMVALNKFRRGSSEAYAQLVEELADVLVVAEQLRYIFGEDAVNDIMNKKIERQLIRMKEENENDSQSTGKSLCNLWKHNS